MEDNNEKKKKKRSFPNILRKNKYQVLAGRLAPFVWGKQRFIFSSHSGGGSQLP